MTQHLVLIGVMGVGKTTIGRRVAQLLGWPLVDSDLRIETTTGRTVRQILADDGEAALRDAEAAALRDALADETPSVFCCAAGVVLDPANLELLAEPTVVWLRGDPAVLAERARRSEHRPWMDDDAQATLARMQTERAPLYTSIADLVVDVDDPATDAATIAEWYAGVQS